MEMLVLVSSYPTLQVLKRLSLSRARVRVRACVRVRGIDGQDDFDTVENGDERRDTSFASLLVSLALAQEEASRKAQCARILSVLAY
jgi:hypothetical protein